MQSYKTCNFFILIVTFDFPSIYKNNYVRDSHRKPKLSRIIEENVCYMNWCFQVFYLAFFSFSMQGQERFNCVIWVITNWCNFSIQYTLLCTWFLWPKVFGALARILLLPEVLKFLLLIGICVYFPLSA